MLRKGTQLIFATIVIYVLYFMPLTNSAQELPSSGIRNTTIDERDGNIIGLDGKKIDTKNLRVGPGMEVIEIGETKVVVPKGTKVHKTGSLITFEDTGEYMSRRFEELDTRLKQIEAQQEELRKELQELHKMVDGLLKRDTISK